MNPQPADVEELTADASKAARVLGWKPEVSFDELFKMMVEADVDAESLKAERDRVV